MIISPSDLTIVVPIIRWFKFRKDTKSVIKAITHLIVSDPTRNFTTTKQIAEKVSMPDERVRDICQKSKRINRYSGDDYWRLT